MEENKITMHLEVTDGTQNQNSSDFFVSGPVNIFASIDDLSTTFTDDICGLYSPEFKNIVENSDPFTNKEPIIVFVRNLFDTSDPSYQIEPGSLKYRGSYFLYDYDNDSWQEILIGTHTHENKEILDKFSEIDVFNADGKTLGIVTTDDGFEFTLLDENKLPSLPKYITDIVKSNTSDPEIPVDSESHHLDGTALYKIDDHTTIASCNDLYDYLRTKGKHLRLKDNQINMEEGQIVDIFEHLVVVDDILSIHSIFDFESAYTLEKYDFILFKNGEIVNPLTYEARGENTHCFVKIKSSLISTGDNLSLIAVEQVVDGYTVNDIYDLIASGEITLESLREAAFKVYIDIALNKKKDVPKVYLTNDDSGNLVWENNLLPTQTFYSKSKTFFNDEITYNGDDESHILVDFDDVYFDFEHDFPLIIVNQLFAFDAKYFITGSERDHLTLQIPTSPYFDLSDDEADRVTLIVIKNTSGNVLSKELMRDYVSKDEAIQILSRGKLSLDQYAKLDDLKDYALFYHTHHNYALTSHTHDYRYADYHHTHAEYVSKAAVVQLLNKALNGDYSADDLQLELSESTLQEIYKEIAEEGFIKLSELEAILNEAGYSKDEHGNYFYSSDNVRVDLSEIDERLVEYLGENITPDSTLNLTDFLERVLYFFENDTVTTDQVLLENDLEVKVPVGGLKEFSALGSRTKYEVGTPLTQILQDMIDPQLSIPEIEAVLTPVSFEIKFYSDENRLNEIDFDNFYYDDTQMTVYYKVTKLLNIAGNECVYSPREGVSYKTVIGSSKANILKDGEILYTEADNTSFEITPNKIEWVEIVVTTLPITTVSGNQDNMITVNVQAQELSSDTILFDPKTAPVAYTIKGCFEESIPEFTKIYRNTKIEIPPCIEEPAHTLYLIVEKDSQTQILYNSIPIQNVFVDAPEVEFFDEFDAQDELYKAIKYEILQSPSTIVLDIII